MSAEEHPSPAIPLPPPAVGDEPVSVDGPTLTGARAEAAAIRAARAAAPRPPRPKVYAALLLLLAGATLSIIGALLPWWDGNGYTRSGVRILFARAGNGYRTIHGPGYVVIALAGVSAVLGSVMLFIGRSITLCIISIVSAGVGFLYSLACLGIVQDTRAVVGGGTVSFGVPVAIIGAAATLVGSILALARRRYPEAQAEAAQ